MFDTKKTKAVLWDLDDTLYNRRDAARKMFPGMFRALLYPGQTDAFLEEAADYMMTQVPRNSMIHEDAFWALLAKYPPEMPYVRAGCVEYYYTHLRRFVAPSPEPLAVVLKLKELGIKNAIVTNITPEILEFQHKKVEALGFAHLFDEIIYSAEFGIHKPDRRIFDHAASLLGVSNDQCLFVGDDPDSDILGARNAGMEALWLDRWEDSGRFSDDPHVHRVQSVTEYFKF